jgi:hypothetical protein
LNQNRGGLIHSLERLAECDWRLDQVQGFLPKVGILRRHAREYGRFRQKFLVGP